MFVKVKLTQSFSASAEMMQRAQREDALTCSICLETLKDPVTLPCGHSYCMDCIQTNWNQAVSSSCPQCREVFTPRPVLVKNIALANLVEELPAPPADHCYVGPGDVSCDVCTGRKRQRKSKRTLLHQNLQHKETEQDRLRQDISCPEPSSREDFLSYARDITLDPNTAHDDLSLSDGNRRVTLMSESQSYPRHQDRFVYERQVLSSEGLTGRCYWEVELSGRYYVIIAVSYRDIKRNGRESSFGNNDKSWALDCDRYSYSQGFNEDFYQVSGPVSSRIGVYLDHSAGALSFYSVQDQTMSLLHRVQTSFSQPLFVGFWFYRVFPGASAHLVKVR